MKILNSSSIKNFYNSFTEVKNFYAIKNKILGLPKKIFYDPEKMLDLDIYGDLKNANKIVILSHTISEGSDGLVTYLAERFNLFGYAVVAFNSPGYRNIITDEPFTGERKSLFYLSYILDNILDFIRSENTDAPIVASAFSAGGAGLIDHFATHKRDVAGVVVLSSLYYTPRKLSPLQMIAVTIPLFMIYSKNFILKRNFKKLTKIFFAGFDCRQLYRINNNEKTQIQRNNLTDTPIVGLHCKDDTFVDIEDARMYFKRMNSPVSKLIEFENQGHSITHKIVNACIDQSDILCNNWILNKE